MSFKLQDVRKIIVLREDPKTKEVSISPLHIGMIGKTYVTKDGKSLGDRGEVDLDTIIKRAAEINAAKKGHRC